MKLKVVVFLLSLYVIFLFSCRSKSHPMNLLLEARNLAESSPQEAMRLIDSISDPASNLDKEEYMSYLVTRVQVYYKNFRDISDDTLIFKARDYYDCKKTDVGNLRFLAHFYSGSVFRDQKNYFKTVEEYKRALSIAKSQDNQIHQAFVLYNLGDLYFEKRTYDISLAYYKDASIKYKNDKPKQALSLQAAGQSFLLKGEIDSALLYFDKALMLIRQAQNKLEEAKCLQNISVALFEKGDFLRSISFLYTARQIDPDSTAEGRYQLNLARTYKAAKILDSAEFYSGKLKNSIKGDSDTNFKAAASKFLAENYIDKKNYRLAIHYMQLKDSLMLQIIRNTNVQELANAERRFDLETKKSQLANEKTRNYRLGLILTLSFLIILIIGLIVLYLSLKQRRQKEENIRQKEENVKLQQQSERNECLIQVYRNHIGNTATFKSQINNLIVKYSRKDIKDPRIGFEKIRETVEDMEVNIHSGYTSFITNYLKSLDLLQGFEVAQLKLEEQLLITLLHANFEHAEIAGLLQIKSHALTTRKSRLKSKLQLIGLLDSQISEIFEPNK
ncbi:tetratricopeptide repeat protein [Sphingobacterium thalpophilum]|nr:tetratricopeptide repeat protein [Sphingobacterium thalpophilum]